LGFDVAALCHEEDERLNLTEFTQPCILTAEIAMLEALRAEHGLAPTIFAGHSLGEYTALVAAGAMPFEVALALVHLRGQLMQRAVPAGEGAMVALSMMTELPLATIAEYAARHEVDLANLNSPTQVVLSGAKGRMERAVGELERSIQDLKTTWLNVSAPFHSRLMRSVEPEFRAALDGAREDLDAPRAKGVTSNFSGSFYDGDLDGLVDGLTRQISGSVRWTDNMKTLLASADSILEVGPNRPLRKFFGALDAPIKSIIDLRSARRALREDS
jgi:[acyl-carrier-protein] S-malonyltransferase/trans-AT polyketide synthase/acyltransferase/oxidoreductase domain-containing protein